MVTVTALRLARKVVPLYWNRSIIAGGTVLCHKQKWGCRTQLIEQRPSYSSHTLLHTPQTCGLLGRWELSAQPTRSILWTQPSIPSPVSRPRCSVLQAPARQTHARGRQRRETVNPEQLEGQPTPQDFRVDYIIPARICTVRHTLNTGSYAIHHYQGMQTTARRSGGGVPRTDQGEERSQTRMTAEQKRYNICSPIISVQLSTSSGQSRPLHRLDDI